MITYSWSVSISSSAGGRLAANWQDDGNIEVTPNVSVPAASVNFATGIAFNGTNLRAIELVSNQNCTLYINAPSTGTPFATINLLAGIPFIWSANAAQIANPLNVNVTNIYVTCTPSLNIQGRILTN